MAGKWASNLRSTIHLPLKYIAASTSRRAVPPTPPSIPHTRTPILSLTTSPPRPPTKMASETSIIKRAGRSNGAFVWIDLEMTGLAADDPIIEICCILTDSNLDPLRVTPPIAPFHRILHCPQDRLDQMDHWCTRTHGASGLTAACVASTVTVEHAARDLLEYVTTNLGSVGVVAGQALLAGNTVHFDKYAMKRYPEFNPVLDFLHYRIFDVSSVKEAMRRWCPDDVLEGAPKKEFTHRAVDDIMESIQEARYYRDVIFTPATRVEYIDI